MKEALSEIIQLATVDSEPWVLMVADILKSFPETGSLNLDLEEQNPNVQDILGELREKGQSDINDWSVRRGSKVIVNNFQFHICLFFLLSSSISSQLRVLFLPRLRCFSILDYFWLHIRSVNFSWSVWQLVVGLCICVSLLGTLCLTQLETVCLVKN